MTVIGCKKVSFALAIAAAATVALLATDTAGGMPRGRGGRVCFRASPDGQSVTVAWTTAQLFVADVILGRNPACGHDLATVRLRGSRSRAAWARGEALSPFSAGYPPVPIVRASRERAAREAVYMTR